MKKLIPWMTFLLGGAIFFSLGISLDRKSGVEDIGLMAVKYLYNFQDAYELDSNMEPLQEITTPEVYDSLTIDKTDRVFNIYLKFKGNPVVPIIEDYSDKYVIYRLDTESIRSSRKFVFFYNVDDSGKISWVREGELVDFSSTNTFDSD